MAAELFIKLKFNFFATKNYRHQNFLLERLLQTLTDMVKIFFVSH